MLLLRNKIKVVGKPFIWASSETKNTGFLVIRPIYEGLSESQRKIVAISTSFDQ